MSEGNGQDHGKVVQIPLYGPARKPKRETHWVVKAIVLGAVGLVFGIATWGAKAAADQEANQNARLAEVEKTQAVEKAVTAAKLDDIKADLADIKAALKVPPRDSK